MKTTVFIPDQIINETELQHHTFWGTLDSKLVSPFLLSPNALANSACRLRLLDNVLNRVAISRDQADFVNV